MKLRTLFCGAVLAAANLLLPVPQAEAFPLAPHPIAPAHPGHPYPAAVLAAAPGPHPAYCFFAYRPLAPLPLVLVAPPARPC